MVKLPHIANVRWTTLAIIIGLPIVLGVLVWVLAGLSPNEWCSASVDAAKDSGTVPNPRDCTAILTALIGVKDHAIIGLLSVVGIAFIVIVVRDLKATASFRGPGGFGGEIGGDDDDYPHKPECAQ